MSDTRTRFAIKHRPDLFQSSLLSPSGLRNDARWDAITHGLTESATEEGFFGLSFMLLRENTSELKPNISAWQIQEGQTLSYLLGHDETKITVEYAVNLMTMFNYDLLITAAQQEVAALTPNGDGDEFTVCASKYGLLILNNDYRDMVYRGRAKGAFSVLATTPASQHQKLQQLASLEACANALLRYQLFNQEPDDHERIHLISQ